MRKSIVLALTILLLGVLGGCGSRATVPTSTRTSVSPTATTMPPTVVAAAPTEAMVAPAASPTRGSIGAEGANQQIAAGREVYTTDCASCHGANLQGVDAPALTASILSTYGNAKALVEFISSQMPQGAPGALSETQYYEVTAYIMQHVGLLAAGRSLTPEDAPKISLTTAQTAAATRTAVPAGASTPQRPTVVQVAQIPAVGDILTNDRGFTLYRNKNDKPSASTCTRTCADTWPPLMVPKDTQPVIGPEARGQVGVFERLDGTYQVSYTDMPTYDHVPLYTYSADTEPGDRNGESLFDTWYSIVLPPSAAPTVPTSAATGPGDAALGAPVYLQSCTPCHGIEGQGVDAPPLRNSQYVQTAGDGAVLDTISNGQPGTEMPAWLQANGGPLTEAQINNVVAFLHTLQGVPPLLTVTPAPEEPTPTLPASSGQTPTPTPHMESGSGEAGRHIAGNVDQGRSYFGLYCASCHGPQGVQGIPNPGSDDGSVPPLNPIDPTIASPDPQVFGSNVDQFMQQGSVPEGPSPLLLMPPFGQRKMLTQQQIADLVAYVMSLNGTKEPIQSR
jgi:mono/diheme cytochrome c family protein